MNNPKILGQAGEDRCERYLIENGYKILKRNYFSRYGEIDIIAQNKYSVAFVEVKTRTDEDIDHILMSITKKKQRNITKTAKIYISENEAEDDVLEYRFDVVILTKENDDFHIEHIKNAFRATEIQERIW